MKTILKYQICFLLTFSFAFIYAGEKFYNKKENTRINLVDSDIYSTTIDFSFDDYHLEEVLIENELYYKIKIDGGSQLLSLGNPDIPKVSTSLMIPDNSNMKLEIIASDFELYECLSI